MGVGVRFRLRHYHNINELKGRLKIAIPFRFLLHVQNPRHLDFLFFPNHIMSFNTIPILDLSLAKDPATKPQFLEELRHALLEVGFLYLKNVGVPEELTQAVVEEGVLFFDLPMEEKFVPGIYEGKELG